MGRFLLTLIAAVLVAQVVVHILAPERMLAGYGCDGAGGVIYAYAEDDFPRCERIE